VALPKSQPPNNIFRYQLPAAGSEGWEELVEVEWEGVELLAARVSLEGPEPVPEMVPPVLPHGAVSPVQGVVQKIRHSPGNKRLGGEYHVDHIIELDMSTRKSIS